MTPEETRALIAQHRPSRWRSLDNDQIVLRCCGQDFGRLTGKPRRSDRSAVELWEEHLADALSRTAAPDAQEAFDPYLSPAQVHALPVGSVIMTETDPEVFGVYEQRVYHRLGGESGWQYMTSRYERPLREGGLQQIEELRGFCGGQRVRLLYTPGALPVGGDDE